jgi:ATP-dependent helicase/DNAse subunit B
VHVTERRQARRYRVALPATLEHGTGQTRDISTSGLFVETDQSFSAGASISLSLMFDGGDRMQCEGQVVRVERCEENTGIAVAIVSYRFASEGGSDG